jgi:hypothetical protein
VKKDNLGAKFVLACGEKLALEKGGKEVPQHALHNGRLEFLVEKLKLLGKCGLFEPSN